MKEYELGSPIRANLEITEVCPLACKHCYTYWGYAATGKRTSVCDEQYELAHFTKIIDILSSLGIRMLTFTGGEPFSRKDILYDLIKYAKKRSMIVFVNTSASLICSDDKAYIRDVGADGYLVSLMSYKRKVNNALSQFDSFDNTVKGIKILSALGQNITVNMVCSKENYKDVRATAKFVESLGVYGFSAAPMMAALSYPEYLEMRLSKEQLRQVLEDILWVQNNTKLLATTLESLPYCAFNDSDLSSFRSILSHSYCGAGMTDIAIACNGDVRPCIMSSKSVGNLLTDDWDDLWNNMSIWRTEKVLPEECLSCEVVDECGGGCRVSALTVNNSINGKDPYMENKLDCIPWDKDEYYLDLIDKDKSEIDLNVNYRISKDVVDRREPFGGTLFIGSKAIFLKEDPYKLFLILKKMDTFSSTQVIKKHRIKKEEYIEFVRVLLDESIVEMVG